MRITKKAQAAAAVMLIVALSGAGAYLRIADHRSAAAQAAQPSDLPANSAADAFGTDLAVAVEGTAAVRDTLVMSVGAPGEVASWQKTMVRAQVAGLIRVVHVRENQAVGRGALLLEIDPTEHRLSLDEARARLRQAEVSYRETTLDDARIEDPRVRAERDTAARARSGLEAALVAVRRAELNLERTRIGAPFGGRVADLKVVPGQYVNAGDELLTVQSMDPVRIEAQVMEGQIGYLAAGRTARVTLSAFPGEEFTGRIETINPVVAQPARTARVTVSVANPRGRILPGMYAYVHLPAERFADRVLVPREAILERDNRRTLLFVFEPDREGSDRGRAKWRYVTPGRMNDTHVELLDDPEKDAVSPGEIVLVSGHHTLQHDIPVRLVENAVRAEGARPR